MQQQQKVITGQEAKSAFQCAYAPFLQQQSSQGDYCASGKNNPSWTGVPAVAACSGNAGECMSAVTPGWKHCKDELRASGGKVIPNKVECLFPEYMLFSSVILELCRIFWSCYRLVTLTVLLLLPCESRDAGML